MALVNLTVLYLTANEVPEVWAEYQRSVLNRVIYTRYPLISISRKPINFGKNILDTEEKSIFNIYKQMLVGAKIATTPYVAVVEDDVLYAYDHFEFRPPLDAFAYDMNRLGLFTWKKDPMYFWKNRVSNSMLIAPRELMIEALEERIKSPMFYKIHGELGRNNIESKMGVTLRNKIEFYSETSSIRFDHDFGYDHAARHHRKKEGPIKAYDIPGWGKASELVKKFV